MIFPGQRDEWFAGFMLNVGRINDGQATGGQSFGGDEMQNFESI
jgi:hypothetical protein